MRHRFGMGTQANTMRLQRVALLALGLFAAWSVGSAWTELPPQMASHFNVRGNPDGFMPRESFFTFLALLGGGVTVLLLLVPALLRIMPVGCINLPHRDYWLAPERRVESLGYIAIWFGWIAIATGALLVVLLDQTIRANVAGTSLDALVVNGSLAIYFFGTMGSLVFFTRRFSKLPTAR